MGQQCSKGTKDAPVYKKYIKKDDVSSGHKEKPDLSLFIPDKGYTLKAFQHNNQGTWYITSEQEVQVVGDSDCI